MPYDPNVDSLGPSAMMGLSPQQPPDTHGAWGNFVPGSAKVLARSMASLGRSISMAGAAIPTALDWAIDPYSPVGEALGLQDKSLQDRYFKWHDDTAGRAVDYWTPRPNEVGTAGKVVGELVGGVAKFLASPALMVADSQLSTAEDLVRQGVDATTAQGVGAIAGVSNAIGIRAPAAVGNTLVQRVASGAAINVAQNAVATQAQRTLLEQRGAPDAVTAQFNPGDVTARTVDALMGAVFGGVAHMQAQVTPTQRDAIMLANQARALELGSLPGKPATPGDLTAAVDKTKTAMDQMARGEPVSVGGEMPRFEHDPQAAADRQAIAALTPETEAPIKGPPMVEPATIKPAEPGAAELPRFDDSVRVPTGEFDPKTGAPVAASANEVIAKTAADIERVKTTAPNLFRVAAECLLGGV